MPTSSQALILLSCDCRLPPSPRQPLVQTTQELYPTRTHDINLTCIDIDGRKKELAGDVAVPRRNGIKYDELISTLPDLLHIKGYHGSLPIDVNAKVMRWKIDTEVTSRQMEEFLIQRDEAHDLYKAHARTRFPSIEPDSTVYKSKANLFKSTNKTTNTQTNFNGNTTNDQITIKPTSESYDLNFDRNCGDKNSNSRTEEWPLGIKLPSVFKTTITPEEYKRLCELGFRHKVKAAAKSKKHHKVSFQNEPPMEAWASPRITPPEDKSQESPLVESQTVPQGNKTPETHSLENSRMFSRSHKPFEPQSFTFELNKGTNGILSEAVRRESRIIQEHAMHVQMYMAERQEFFSKYGEYATQSIPKLVGETPLVRGSDVMIKHVGHLPDISEQSKLIYSSLLKSSGEGNDVIEAMSDDTSALGEKIIPKSEVRSLIDHVSSMTNYNKWKKQKLTTLRLRRELPPPQPTTVCFSLHDNALPHEEVKRAVEQQARASVCRLQFDPVAVHALDSEARSRWVASLPTKEACERLIPGGVIVNGDWAEVRYLDDALKEEYEAYKLFQMVQRGEIKMPSFNQGAKRKKRKTSNATQISTDKSTDERAQLKDDVVTGERAQLINKGDIGEKAQLSEKEADEDSAQPINNEAWD